MRRQAVLVAVLIAACAGPLAPVARAQIGVQSFVAAVCNDDYDLSAQNCAGAGSGYYTQAGGHPFTGVTDFTVANTGGVPNATVSTIRVDIPPGLISNPQAVAPCTSFPSCPSSSQVGVVSLELYVQGLGDQYFGASVYNVPPPAGKVSDFAFQIALTPLITIRTDIVGGVRSTSDDGLFFTIAVPSSAVPAQLVRSTLIFWGVPGDSAHEPDLGWECDPVSAVLQMNPKCLPPDSGSTHNLSGTPFLSLPSGCVPAGQTSTLTLSDSTGATATATSATPVPATGCQSVPFDPSISIAPATTQADTPTGLAVDLHVPQNNDPGGLATSTLQSATVTLPPGLTLDPSAANGLAACSPAQFGQGSDAPPSCPAASRVGTVEIDTPLLAQPLTGAVYLGCDGAPPTPCPASSGLSFLYVYATSATYGVTQKLVGTVSADPASGQLTTTFANQPQVPFSDLKLSFKGGPNAPLANPLACGTATVTSSLTPWSGNPASSPTAAYEVDSNGSGGACPQPAPFSPSLVVAESSPQAGAFIGSFSVVVARADGQQYLRALSVSLPRGLLGMVASVPLCAAAQASSGTCGAASQIGHVTVYSGAGPEPVLETGAVYLTGPYAGAPFGLSIVVPALAGPFDLGTVVVRTALAIDRADAHVSVVSDPLPQVLDGIPLRYKVIGITIDRPRFLFNPTSCAPLATSATVTSASGATATPASPFQAVGCSSLPFAPTLKVALGGRGQTRSGGHPTLTVSVTSAPGQANIRSASVALPRSLGVDLTAAQSRVCLTAASLTDSCPASSIVGSARIVTPLLGQPLTGPVYFVQGSGANPLPALLVTLRGQVAIDLRSQTSISGAGNLVTTFPAIPDAPLSSFVLQLNGGRQGILAVAAGSNLCTAPQTVHGAFLAQSGRAERLAVTPATPCGNRAHLESARVVRHSVKLRVDVPVAGALRASAPGMRALRRRLRGPAALSLTLRLTGGGAARLRQRGRLRLRVTIRFTPRGGRAQTIRTRVLTIRR